MALAPGTEESNSSLGPQSNTGWTGVRRSKHCIPPWPDGTSWALVLFFSSRTTARWDKGPHDRRYTAFCRCAQDVRMDHLSQACLNMVKLLSLLHFTPLSSFSPLLVAILSNCEYCPVLPLLLLLRSTHCHIAMTMASPCRALPCLALACLVMLHR
jgi:hypothetical protein